MLSSEQKLGKIKLITGPMFAGKTTALINEANNVVAYSAFKPIIDNRYSDNEIVSHNKKYIQATPVKLDEEISKHINDDISLVIIDEIQFFSEQILDEVVLLKKNGIDVLLAGLNTDYRKEPFPITSKFEGLADEIIVLQSECKQCGSKADYTYRTFESSDVVLVGGSENYEPRCLSCYDEN